MTSADFCSITPGIAPRRAACAWLLAALFARTGWQHFPCAQACSTSGLTGRLLRHASHSHVGQISPDKNVNCGYTTAAFLVACGDYPTCLRQASLLNPGFRCVACLCVRTQTGANLPGDWALYAISVRRLVALRFGFLRTPPHGGAP